ncbi:MAG TPA: cell envelope integrity protein TolA, partial [Caulobacteraceae bacterium]|nr:cell envelope integrity protein TolA [Caulobacteraceae bacterium]
HPPPLVSYSVDLVAPDKVGGTNLIHGGKGRVEAPPMAAASKEEPKPPPPPPKVEPPKPPPAEVAKAVPAPPPEPPKIEEKPNADEIALAERTQKSEPPPTATPGEPAAPTAPPQPPPTAVPTVDLQAEKAAAEAEAAKEAQVRAVKEAAAKAAKEAEAKAAKEAAQAKVAKEAAAAKDAAEAKAKAVADAKAAKETAEAKSRDDHIAAAVKRVQAQEGARGGGTGAQAGEQTGGSLSVGPGEGVGGVVMGVQYLMYRNQLESRIKQNWAWAGSGRDLQTVIHFSITETGEVTDVHITKSSGDAAYDASVQRAVRAVNPLPPPPEQYRKEFSNVEYTFTPESLQM